MKQPDFGKVDLDYSQVTHNSPTAVAFNPGKPSASHPMMPKGKNKVEKVMHEYKEGELHSGSKHGPVVTSREQAIAIGLSEQRAYNKRKK